MQFQVATTVNPGSSCLHLPDIDSIFSAVSIQKLSRKDDRRMLDSKKVHELSSKRCKCGSQSLRLMLEEMRNNHSSSSFPSPFP